MNPIEALERRVGIVRRALLKDGKNTIISTQSITIPLEMAESADYIFTDPPFGSNIIYSDLNILWESWLRASTNTQVEAVVHRRKQQNAHTLAEYAQLMTFGFRSMFAILKSGRWLTVEFHNTQNAVWNIIQEAISRAGFVIADVRTLDKQQGSFKQVTASGAVKQDLVISAYKPTAAFEQRFTPQTGTENGAWAFLDEHLGHLPMPLVKDGVMQALAERQPYLLYDRMVAFHIQRGLTVPLSAAEFYAGLARRYPSRDGMVFRNGQAAEYDALKRQAPAVQQLPLIVTDEKTARIWLQQTLQAEPLTHQNLQPRFLRELHQAGYEQMPELRQLLEDSFLQDEQGRWFVPDPGRAEHLERLREKDLLNDFAVYRSGKGRLKTFRGEALRAGFRAAWRRRDYQTIVQVAERLPERVLQEDPDLLMYYDNATMRLEGAS